MIVAPTIPVMRAIANGMKLTPRAPASETAIGNMKTAEADVVIRLLMTAWPTKTAASAV